MKTHLSKPRFAVTIDVEITEDAAADQLNDFPEDVCERIIIQAIDSSNYQQENIIRRLMSRLHARVKMFEDARLKKRYRKPETASY